MYLVHPQHMRLCFHGNEQQLTVGSFLKSIHVESSAPLTNSPLLHRRKVVTATLTLYLFA